MKLFPYKTKPSFSFGRRRFLERMAAMFLALEAATKSARFDYPKFKKKPMSLEAPFPGSVPFIGIQMSPHTMLDEGIEFCLDLIQREAAVNAIMPYSHAFHGPLGKPLNQLAHDHGKPPRDLRGRLPAVWVKHHSEFFKETKLRIKPTDPNLEFADRDLFSELIKPCRQRGIRVYARILESTRTSIENFDLVRTIDCYGHPGRYACWSHPDYLAFWRAVVQDMFSHYDLDGLQWGAERMGPLMNVILPWNDLPPTCFCSYCQDRGRAAGIDPERAKEGYRRLYEFVRDLRADRNLPAEGIFTVFLRHLIRWPEILAWEYQYRLSREAVHRSIYEAVKLIKPEAEVGWHIDHQPSSWDPIYRAEMSYEEMAPYSDFIKLILYHAILGPRIRHWYLERFKGTILKELSLEQSLSLYYAIMGYDPQKEPTVDNLEKQGFSPDYVYRETKRSVASANEKTKIYAGIGFDIPGSPPDEPEKIYEATLAAFRAGASGIVISREYEEMRVLNLKAIGQAIRELLKGNNLKN